MFICGWASAFECSVHKGQKRVSGPLRLDLLLVGSHRTRVTGIKERKTSKYS